MTLTQLTVNNASSTNAPDASTLTASAGRQGDLLVSELHGKYFNQSYRGAVYYAATAATGVTLSQFSSGTVTGLGLWNPTGSGKNVVLTRMIIAPLTAAGTVSTLGISWLINTGAAVGTAAPLSATTPITATRGSTLMNTAAGQGNSVVIAVSAATATTGPALYIPFGSIGTVAVTAYGLQPPLIVDFDGLLVAQPGVFLNVCNSASSTGTYNVAMFWEEVPV